MVVDFVKRMDLAIVNIYFKKKDKRSVTYKSGGKSAQVNYVISRRRDLKKICDCKVMVNECVASSILWWYAKWLHGQKGRRSKAQDKVVETSGDELSIKV